MMFKGNNIMISDLNILKYITTNQKDIEDYDDVVLKNDLPLHLIKNQNVIREKLLSNKIYEVLTVREVSKIKNAFFKCRISPIFFKGIFLGRQLYEQSYVRRLGDIDIFVSEDVFNVAADILLDLGYIFSKSEKMAAKHHVVFNNDLFFVELHKYIYHPMLSLNELYLTSNCTSIILSNENFLTFDISATVLHLIYHLYMDTYLTYGSLYFVLVNRKIPKANRFLYRAYEISLFSEKYFEIINWEDIENDVSTQKLRIIFKKMIFDILEIFPNAFPKSFVDTVCKINYVDDGRDQLYKYFLDRGIINNSESFDNSLSNYINDNWKARIEKNIYKKVGETISLTKESSDETKQNLNCAIDTEKTIEGLKIVFRVSNDDFYISETDNYDTQASDGVHLLLCGTEEYSYNSIFFFPKQIDGEIRVVVCDVLNNRNQILTDDLIKAEFSKTENDYTITAMLSNKFLKKNNLNSYLYMGLVISDCSSETHRRKNQLILSEEDSQWYNPTYFAKIDME